MTPIGSRSTVNDHSSEIVQSIRIDSVIRCIEQTQLKRKDNAMRHLDVAIELFHILETLQMQCQYHGQLLDAHTLLRLLIAAAIVALELVVRAECFRVAEAAQAVRDRCVLIHIDLQIEEVLILAAHRLAVEATCLRSQYTLENLMHPSGFRVGSIGLCDGRHCGSQSTIAIQDTSGAA